MESSFAKRVLESALLCAQQPMTLRELRRLFDGGLDETAMTLLLTEIAVDWGNKGIELVKVASGWRFQTRADMAIYLEKLNPEKVPKYTRVTLESLAIIAYRQPVTRGEMEQIRGVTIATQQLKQLEERGWVEVVGYRETVGRPALYATTKKFLDDLGLQSLDQLPILESGRDTKDASLTQLPIQVTRALTMTGDLFADQAAQSST